MCVNGPWIFTPRISIQSHLLRLSLSSAQSSFSARWWMFWRRRYLVQRNSGRNNRLRRDWSSQVGQKDEEYRYLAIIGNQWRNEDLKTLCSSLQSSFQSQDTYPEHHWPLQLQYCSAISHVMITVGRYNPSSTNWPVIFIPQSQRETYPASRSNRLTTIVIPLRIPLFCRHRNPNIPNICRWQWDTLCSKSCDRRCAFLWHSSVEWRMCWLMRFSSKAANCLKGSTHASRCTIISLSGFIRLKTMLKDHICFR